jgi:hypothetical protein
MLTRRLAWGVLIVALLTGCNTMRQIAGLPVQAEPSIDLKSAEGRWLLIKNPRFGDVPSEPEYIWVEEDKVPTTMKSFVFGQSTLLAPPEIVARYGSPPGGGRISPRQGGAFKVENVIPTGPEARSASRVVTNTTRTDAATAIAAQPMTRGYVVFVDTSRVVIDLAASDGVKLGTTVSVRRDKIAIVHPITGELLGELDEEVATGRVVEVRDKFSVVEVQKAAAGAQVQVKDRVVLR